MSNWTKPVIVGYDASREGHYALQWAAQVAQRRGVSLTVVHASGAQPSSVNLARPGILGMYQRRAQEIAEEGARRARAMAPVEIRAVGLQGGAVEALVEQSERASLVVLGHRTRGALREAIVGSVALAVTTHAVCPVAVIRLAPAPLPSMEHPLVVGVDGSEHSMRALDEAAFLAADTGSFLRIVTAWQPPDEDAWSAYHRFRDAPARAPKSAPTQTQDAWSAYHQVRAELAGDRPDVDSYDVLLREVSQGAEDTAQQALRRVQDRYPELKAEPVVSKGSAAQAILGAADGASLIVVGARGYSALKGLLLGSVSRKVMNQAECAVYVIR